MNTGWINIWKKRVLFLGVGLLFLFGGPQLVRPQGNTPASSASYSDVYCSGFVSGSLAPTNGQVLGAEGGSKKNDLVIGDLLYLGDGTVSTAQVGQEFFVIRPIQNLGGLGTIFTDVAHVQIVDLNGNVATAKITFNCVPVNVGDWLVPPQARFFPPLKPYTPVDRLAHASGKADGEIVASKENLVQLGQRHIVYLDLGTAQGIQVGSVLRIYRPPIEAAVNNYNRSRVKKYEKSANFPRQILGECVVLQVGENTAVALITASLEEAAVGDHVELE